MEVKTRLHNTNLVPLRRWCNTEASKSVAVLGAAIATCCGHKIGAEDKHIFAEIHSEDPYLRHLTGEVTKLQETVLTAGLSFWHGLK